MRAWVLGTVVELDRNDWTMPGVGGRDRSGTTFTAFVRTERERDEAARVRVTEAQFKALNQGDRVEWPCDFGAVGSDWGGQPKLKITLDPDFDISATDATGQGSSGSRTTAASAA
jgi:hypothetical protein